MTIGDVSPLHTHMLFVSQETIGQGFRLAGGTLVKVGTTEVNPTPAEYAEAISAFMLHATIATRLYCRHHTVRSLH